MAAPSPTTVARVVLGTGEAAAALPEMARDTAGVVRGVYQVLNPDKLAYLEQPLAGIEPQSGPELG